MAGANLPAKKYSKTAPTQLRLSFEFEGNATQFIDIAMALSAVNRKFYRQGVYYYVNSVELYNNEDSYVDLHVCPDTWITKNAWNRGFRMFQQMNALAPASIRPKYHDFKVYMSDRHRTTGSAIPQTYTINSGNQDVAVDDWQYSQFVSADDDQDMVANADEFYVHILGGHVGSANNWSSVGLIKSYAETRATVPIEQPNDNNIDITDPLLNLFDFSSEEQINDIAQNLLEDNDETPYNLDNYLGETVSTMCQAARLVTSTSLGRVAKAPGFCAPFGLICVDPQNTATAYRIVINLAPGTYHGVYAERA